jgi:type IV secretory pathway VirB2 component (pilin)
MTNAESVGEKAEHSDALDHAVRVGLVAYGVVHLIVAWLAVRLAFGESSGEASGTGALHELAQNTVGRISLYVVAAGLFALVAWQLLEALLGHRDEDGAKRTAKRVISAGKAVVYGTLGVSAVKVAAGASSSSGGTDTMTAKLMSAPGGQVAVALVGLGVIATGCGLGYRGWTEKFLKKLEPDGQTGQEGRAYTWFGTAGYLAKGVALLLVGGLFVYAAWTHDPQKSGGLDEALHQVLEQPFGPALLIVIALGIACYGLFCFAWARHLDR